MTSSETEKLTKSIGCENELQQPNEAEDDGEEKQDDFGRDTTTQTIVNPFVHKVEWNDPFDKFRVSTGSLFLFSTTLIHFRFQGPHPTSWIILFSIFFVIVRLAVVVVFADVKFRNYLVDVAT